MTARRPELVVRRFFDALNDYDLDQAVGCLDAGYRGVDLSRSATVVGPAEARADFAATWSAFSGPSLSLRAHAAAQAQSPEAGARVLAIWVLDGTHAGSCLRVPATREPVSLSGLGLLSVQDERITRAVYQWDLAGFLRAAKLLPDLPEGDVPEGDVGASLPALSTPEP